MATRIGLPVKNKKAEPQATEKKETKKEPYPTEKK